MAEKKEEKPNPGPSQNSTPQQNELTCSLCSKTFRSRTGFREHQDKHVVGSKSHFCPVVDCERKFTNITTLQRHIASKHQGIKISACQCNIKDKFEEKHCYKSWLVTNCMFYCKIFKFTRTSDLARRSARRMKMKFAKILQTPLIPKAVRELTGYQATRRPAAGILGQIDR